MYLNPHCQYITLVSILVDYYNVATNLKCLKYLLYVRLHQAASIVCNNCGQYGYENQIYMGYNEAQTLVPNSDALRSYL